MKTLPKSLAASALCLSLAACSTPPTPGVSATATALCDAWEDALPTRSRDDTTQTQLDIVALYDVFEAACQRPVRL